jgi:LysR family transcriptional regulator, low CO2-responsive transcriptional regulator
MGDITLRQLRVVAAVAKTGKILAAADLLGVTPPAVTLQLKQLEESLGMGLFERSRDGMKLTAAGHHLMESIHRIDAELASCAEGFNAMRGLKGGSVSIGVVSTAKYFAPAALGAFKRRHPEVELRLLVANREETIRALAALELDLAIMGRPPENLDLGSALLGDHPHIIIAAPDHRLACKSGLPIEELRSETFLVREPGSGTRMLMERLFEDAGIAPKLGMEISSNETIKQAVMAGLGMAFISAHTVAAEIEMRRLAVIDLVGLPVVRQWRVVHHREKRLMPAADALLRFLEREGQAFLPQFCPPPLKDAAKQQRPANRTRR